MIHVTIDPAAARERYGLAGEFVARAASDAIGNVLEQGAPDTAAKRTGDLVLGGVIGAAIAALAYWHHVEARRGRRARR